MVSLKHVKMGEDLTSPGTQRQNLVKYLLIYREDLADDITSAKRVAIFHMTAPLGSAFSGYLVSVHPQMGVKCKCTEPPSKQQFTNHLTGIWDSQGGDGCTSCVEYVNIQHQNLLKLISSRV